LEGIGILKNERKNKKVVVAVIVVLLLCLFSFPSLFVRQVFADGESWLAGWSYRQASSMLSGTSFGSNYLIRFTIVYNNTDPIWEIYKNNPIIGNGLGNAKGATGVPNTLYVNGTWHIFCSVFSGSWNRNINHFTATRMDGTWTEDAVSPVLDVGSYAHGGHGILKDIETGAPLKYSEYDLGIGSNTTQVYWMFYAYGIGVDTDYKVYIATNDDLDGAWYPESGYGAVLECGSGGQWDDAIVGFDGLQVVWDDDESQFIMIYEGSNGDGPGFTDIQTGVAFSGNLTTWTKSGSNPIIPNGSAGTWDADYAGGADLWKIDGTYLMTYRGTLVSGEETGFVYGTDIESMTKVSTSAPSFVLNSETWATNSSDAVLWLNATDGYDYLIFEGDSPVSGEHWAIGWARTADIMTTFNNTHTNVIFTNEYDSVVRVGTNCQSDFDDIRFTESDGDTLLDYALIEKSDGVSATFDVKVTADLYASNTTVYVYYGNASASSAASPFSTVDEDYDFIEFTEVDTGDDLTRTCIVETCSNSTLSDLTFNRALARLRFNVDGTIGTVGFCKISIPSDLMSGTFSIYKDDIILVENVYYTQTFNGTYYTFSLTYEHSTHTIDIFSTTVIPELTSFIMLATFITATIAVTIYGKKSSKKKKS